MKINRDELVKKKGILDIPISEIIDLNFINKLDIISLLLDIYLDSKDESDVFLY